MQEWTVNEWTVSVRKDCNAVRVYRRGQLHRVIGPGRATYRNGEALKFARELVSELRRQGSPPPPPESADDSVGRKRDDIFRKMFN